jgi:DNA-binding PadR family transcriptional regulator
MRSHSHHHHHYHHPASPRHGDGDRGPGGGRPGPRDGFMRGRKFSSDDLQLMLLSLLAGGASHGYELIKAIQVRSDSVYSPSPGMVYPALTYLAELGMVSVLLDGNKKLYSLAETGTAELAAQQQRSEELLASLTHMARKMKHLRGAMAEDAAGASADGAAWLPEFVAARLAFKRALLLKSDAGHDEQRRLTTILVRATAELETGAVVTPAPGAGGPASH